MDFFVTLNETVILFAMVLLGFLAGRLKIVSTGFSKDISQFLFCICVPAMVIDALQRPFSKEILGTGAVLIATCVGIIVVSYWIGRLIVRWVPAFREEKLVFLYSMAFPNFGYMGIPVVSALLGEEGAFYVALYVLPLYLIVNSWGVYIWEREGQAKFVSVWKRIRSTLNPATVGTLIGFLLFICSIQLPESLGRVVKMTGDLTTPLAMILAGLLLAQADLRQLFRAPKVYILSGIRLLGLPFLFMGILYLCGARGIRLSIPVLITAMPVAANLAMMAEKFGRDAYLSAQIVFLSTLLSVITIPIVGMAL